MRLTSIFARHAAPAAPDARAAQGLLLMRALDCETCDTQEILRLIRDDAGARLDQRDAAGNTPLMYAALRGHAEAARYLITYGAQVNVRNGAGESPLDFALRAKNAEIEDMIRDAGGIPGAWMAPAQPRNLK